jgi:NhaC family Na+:H+ antiporter
MCENDDNLTFKEPSLADALIPMTTLIVLLTLSVYLFGDDASWGPNQIALTFSALVASFIGIKNGCSWSIMQNGVVRSISQALPAVFILLAVGALIGTWAMSGTITTMIYYGLQLLNADIFYPTVFIVTAIVSASIGSSWTTAGTVGLGLIGVAHGLGVSEAVTAGAVISGSYFGDKLSPLSETTNLSSAVVGIDIYTHIRHMLWTTIPSMLITLVIFTVMSWQAGGGGDMALREETLHAIRTHFHTSPWLLLPVGVVIAMALMKMRPMPSILIGALVGGIFAVLFQPDHVVTFVDRADLPYGLTMLAGVWQAMVSGFTSATGYDTIDTLVNRGGMKSMLEVIWLILSALLFGGVMEATGMLERLLKTMLKAVKGTASLVAMTVATSFGLNVVSSDQYMAIVLPGRMFKVEFEKRGLAPENLSRTLEDSGTLTSPLVPWNTCGAYMAATLGVATMSYLPYAFFNLINPFMAILLAVTGIGIKKIEK